MSEPNSSNLPPEDEQEYVNIRELIGEFIGKTIVDITQHDDEEWIETGLAYIMLMFEDGSTLKFYLNESGFEAQIVGQDVKEWVPYEGTDDDTHED